MSILFYTEVLDFTDASSLKDPVLVYYKNFKYCILERENIHPTLPIVFHDVKLFKYIFQRIFRNELIDIQLTTIPNKNHFALEYRIDSIHSETWSRFQKETMRQLVMLKITNDFQSNTNVQLNKILDNYGNLSTEISSNSDNSKISGNSVHLREQFSLFDYQIEDILWMNKVSEIVNPSITCMVNRYPEFMFQDQTYCYTDTGLQLQNELQVFTFPLQQGGNLISNMGMGKTITMLSWLFQKDNFFNIFVNSGNAGNTCHYNYKKFVKQCDKKINSNSDFYCTLHKSTPFIEKMHIVLNQETIHSKFNMYDFFLTVNDKTYFKTNASLIICPPHLCDQWSREYYSKFKPFSKRIIVLVSNMQLKMLTLSEILFADIIIISSTFLESKSRTKRFNLEELLEKEYFTLEQKLEVLKTNNLVIESFLYNSIIVDEYHELSHQTIDIINNLHSTYRWNISGTPFANGIDTYYKGIRLLLGNNNLSENLNYYNNFFTFFRKGIRPELISQTSHLFRRNQKRENSVLIHVKHLLFTEPERHIYNSHLNKINVDRNFLIQLCCDPEMNTETQTLVKNCKTLEEIQQALLGFHILQLNETRNKLKIAENQLEMLIRADSDRTLIANHRRIVTTTRQRALEIERITGYLKNAINTLTQTDSCPICLETSDNLVITMCGHKFCKDCILRFLDTRQKPCPSCKQLIVPSQLYNFCSNSNSNLITGSGSFIEETKSTKLGNVLEMVSKLQSTDRVIIFSQWEFILNKLSTFLNKHHKNKWVFCRGNVYERTKAISQYTNPKSNINVILLSSKHCASGINLTIANKIIMIEPIYGSKEYRENVMSQSIGRADRVGRTRDLEVIKLIIKDTIEDTVENEDTVTQT